MVELKKNFGGKGERGSGGFFFHTLDSSKLLFDPIVTHHLRMIEQWHMHCIPFSLLLLPLSYPAHLPPSAAAAAHPTGSFPSSPPLAAVSSKSSTS